MASSRRMRPSSSSKSFKGHATFAAPTDDLAARALRGSAGPRSAQGRSFQEHPPAALAIYTEAASPEPLRSPTGPFSPAPPRPCLATPRASCAISESASATLEPALVDPAPTLSDTDINAIIAFSRSVHAIHKGVRLTDRPCRPRRTALPAASAHGNRPRVAARRGGRVVDRAALEMRSTCKRTGGSNPSLSAKN